MLFVPRQRGDGVYPLFIYPADALMYRFWKTSAALREKDAARRLVYHAPQHPLLYRDVETIVRVKCALDSEWGVKSSGRARRRARGTRLPKTVTPRRTSLLDVENEIPAH